MSTCRPPRSSRQSLAVDRPPHEDAVAQRRGPPLPPPVHHNTVLIPPTDDEAAAYAAARAAAAEALAAGRHRLHAHAHALRPLTLLCSGVTGKLAEELETRQSGLTARKTSGAWRVHVKMPKQRDDFRFDATVVHSADLYEWARTINVNREHDCASCLQRVTSLNGQGAVALAPCGHLLCVGCKDALLQTAQGAADRKTRERVGVRIHGPDGCFPDDCYLDGRQNEEGQAARATLRSYLMDRIRGIFPSSRSRRSRSTCTTRGEMGMATRHRGATPSSSCRRASSRTR